MFYRSMCPTSRKESLIVVCAVLMVHAIPTGRMVYYKEEGTGESVTRNTLKKVNYFITFKKI